jgi:hypothetical protein
MPEWFSIAITNKDNMQQTNITNTEIFQYAGINNPTKQDLETTHFIKPKIHTAYLMSLLTSMLCILWIGKNLFCKF